MNSSSSLFSEFIVIENECETKRSNKFNRSENRLQKKVTVLFRTKLYETWTGLERDWNKTLNGTL